MNVPEQLDLLALHSRLNPSWEHVEGKHRPSEHFKFLCKNILKELEFHVIWNKNGHGNLSFANIIYDFPKNGRPRLANPSVGVVCSKQTDYEAFADMLEELMTSMGFCEADVDHEFLDFLVVLRSRNRKNDVVVNNHYFLMSGQEKKLMIQRMQESFIATINVKLGQKRELFKYIGRTDFIEDVFKKAKHPPRLQKAGFIDSVIMARHYFVHGTNYPLGMVYSDAYLEKEFYKRCPNFWRQLYLDLIDCNLLQHFCRRQDD